MAPDPGTPRELREGAVTAGARRARRGSRPATPMEASVTSAAPSRA